MADVLARRLRAYPLELLYNLTLRELRGKYKRSALGWMWSIINPLANIAVYSVVFGVFFDVTAPVGDPSGLDVYALFLVAGLLPWTFLSNGLGGAVGSIVANESLVKKVYFPRWILPTSAVGAWFASFAIELLVFGVILLIAGNVLFLWIPVLLFIMVLQAMFVIGLGMILSAVNVYFRDVQHFLAIFLNIWFYATPVLYPPDLPPETYEVFGVDIPVQDILAVNPMAIFVDTYRDVLYNLRYPSLSQLAVLTVGSLATLAAGIVVFRRFEPRLAEVL